jgi:hypothetical protein
MIDLRQKQATLEIQAWTVTGTPAIEAKAGLLESYRTRCSCEREAFVASMVDWIVGRAFATSESVSPVV